MGKLCGSKGPSSDGTGSKQANVRQVEDEDKGRASGQKCSGDRMGAMARTVVSTVAALKPLKPRNEREGCGEDVSKS